jgi:hypothetical protein
MKLGALDLLEQHRGHDWLTVLGAQREAGDEIGFGRKKVNGRTNAAVGLGAHDCFLWMV